jgi:hypothetical protein
MTDDFYKMMERIIIAGVIAALGIGGVGAGVRIGNAPVAEQLSELKVELVALRKETTKIAGLEKRVGDIEIKTANLETLFLPRQ